MFNWKQTALTIDAKRIKIDHKKWEFSSLAKLQRRLERLETEFGIDLKATPVLKSAGRRFLLFPVRTWAIKVDSNQVRVDRSHWGEMSAAKISRKLEKLSRRYGINLNAVLQANAA